jgi:hypothetical protein
VPLAIPISNTLKDLVDIDGKGSDVDLTHWDVSHVSNANKAFVNALKFDQDIGSWDVSKVTNWLKALVPQNIPCISVTLLTSQLPISWLKVFA